MTEDSRRSAKPTVKPENKPEPELGGNGRWPTAGELSASQSAIEDDSLLWLSCCRELSKRRLPQSVFQTIPEDIWRFRIWGSKVIIMRTPQVEQVGRIILADQAKQLNEIGWIVTVGHAIHETEELNVKGKTYPYQGAGPFSPLLAVGALVLFNPYAGKAITTNMLDTGAIQRTKQQQFLLISIADVWGPMVNVQPSDWSSVQEMPDGPLDMSAGMPETSH